MKSLIPYYIVFLCCLGHILPCLSSEIGYDVARYLGKPEGLPGETVTDICVARDGLVWIGTGNGICRYDGREILTFAVDGPVSMPRVYDLCELADGTLCAATEHGLFRLRHGESVFWRIAPEIGNCESVVALGERLFVGDSEGLRVVHDNRVTTLHVSGSPVGADNSVRDIFKAADGSLWLAGYNMVGHFDTKTDKLKGVTIAQAQEEGVAFSKIVVVGNRLFLGTKHRGLWTCNLEGRQFSHVEGVGNVVSSLSVSPKGEVLVGCDGTGAYVVDAATLTVKEHYTTGSEGSFRLPSNAVYCFQESAHGIRLLGFFRRGMLHTYRNDALFAPYQIGSFTTQGLDVVCFYAHDHRLAIGTSDALWLIDEQTGQVRSVPRSQLGDFSITNRIAYYNGSYYLSSFDKGVRVVDGQTLRVHTLDGMNAANIGAMAVSSDNKLWIGSSDGVYIYDGQQMVGHYHADNSRLHSENVTGLTFDSSQNAWICSKGMSLYLKEPNTIDDHCFPAGFFNDERRLVAHRGHGGLMLFRNAYNVYYTDERMQHFGKLDLPAAIRGESLYDMADDMRSAYWLSSGNGLFRITYDLKTMQYFGRGEGIYCQYINGQLHVSADGRIMIATSNGLMVSSLRQIEHWSKQSEYSIRLYDIYRGAAALPMPVTDAICRDKRLSLSWNLWAEDMSLKPMLNDFARSDGRLYEWRTGDDEPWQVVKAGSSIQLPNLWPGYHDLQLRLLGVEGSVTTYRIQVLPSWLFALEVLLLVLGGLLVWQWRKYRSRSHTLLSERNEIETVLTEVEHDRDQALLDADLVMYDSKQKDQDNKYERVNVSDKECQQIAQALQDYIEQKKPYLNPDLRIGEVADQLKVSPVKLSIVFNHYLKEGYYEYINRYRLDEFKRLIAEGDYQRYTVTALSEKCGFKRSNFYSTFRKVEGMTPVEYLKMQKVKMK